MDIKPLPEFQQRAGQSRCAAPLSRRCAPPMAVAPARARTVLKARDIWRDALTRRVPSSSRHGTHDEGASHLALRSRARSRDGTSRLRRSHARYRELHAGSHRARCAGSDSRSRVANKPFQASHAPGVRERSLGPIDATLMGTPVRIAIGDPLLFVPNINAAHGAAPIDDRAREEESTSSAALVLDATRCWSFLRSARGWDGRSVVRECHA